MTTVTCPQCKGKKKIRRFGTVRLCDHCKGTGQVKVQDIVEEPESAVKSWDAETLEAGMVTTGTIDQGSVETKTYVSEPETKFEGDDGRSGGAGAEGSWDPPAADPEPSPDPPDTGSDSGSFDSGGSSDI